MKKLTEEEKQARMVVYEETIAHLGMNIYDNEIERQQGNIITGQIARLANQFAHKYL